VTDLRPVRVGADGAASMAALHRRCFPDAWDADTFEALMAAPSSFAHAVVVGADVVALVLCRSAADEAEVLTIAVDPNWRRRGLARRLLEAVAAAGRARGAARLFCEVALDNAPARALYRGLGFVPVGRRPAYYARPGRPGADALIVCRPLG
jgi:ribosomal-protein-alanine N-acetyltransferase